MLQFRRMRSLQKFAYVHASVTQPLQSGTQPCKSTPLQSQPCRRSRREALCLRELSNDIVVAETGSYLPAGSATQTCLISP